ncbi:MAG: tripartite tricarboxylate transporter permease [Burkholderiales bacterium]|nr:tripartite tricarboxylate transporter permease [Burkholderiales bacterium]
METLQHLLNGFAIAAQPVNLLFAFAGCVLGTLVGVLPGLGASAGIAILLPVTFVLPATGAVIMLAAIYYGAAYGGTITSVLMRVPGEASSAVTCIDGYEMAKRGRGGAALAVAALGSFAGGTLATAGLVAMSLPLAELAVRFGPPEYFALMVLGLTLVTVLAGASLVRGLVAAMIGLLVGMVGTDPVMGAPRFAYGQLELLDGLGVVPVVMGLFGVSEVLANAAHPERAVFQTHMGTLMPTRADLRESAGPIARGTLLGFALGLVPGMGATVPTFLSYALEKKLSRHPERFGSGAIAGVAGPETTNNAYASAAMIPLFTLGLPGSAGMALLMGALMMNGLTPGPFLFSEHADFVWAVIASLYLGNVILLILNLPLIPLWLHILRIPYALLAAVILGFCVLGAYSLKGTVFDVGVMLVFGFAGYAFRKLDIPAVPLVLTLILGPLMEKGLRKSLEMSAGDPSIFLSRPLAAALLVAAAAFLAAATLKPFSRVKRAAAE